MKPCLPKFDRGRFNTYVGNIAEMVAEDTLLEKGYETWFMRGPLSVLQRKSSGTSLVHCLGYLYVYKAKDGYLYRRVSIRGGIPGTATVFERIEAQECEGKLKELKDFFGEKLEAFKQYMEQLGVFDAKGEPMVLRRMRATLEHKEPEHKYVYCPDFVAKRRGQMYVVEVKANKGTDYLKGEKLKGLMLAKEFGFIPMLVTLNVNIDATDLVIREL